MCLSLIINSKAIPTWLIESTKVLSIEVRSLCQLDGGVVSDVWRVFDVADNCYIIRRTPDKHNNAFSIVNMLNKLPNAPYVPRNFRAYAESTSSYITCYTWVDGKVLDSFQNVLCEINDICTWMHSIDVGSNALSIYHDIHKEALYVLQNIENLVNFAQPDIETIRHSATIILDSLKTFELSMILDNRGCLTHGDIKPHNTIRTNDSLLLIDWDKIGSLSPEADLVYAIFSINSQAAEYPIMRKMLVNPSLEKEIVSLSIRFLHHMYLVHDVYVYLTTGSRLLYVKKSVLPQCKWWSDVCMEVAYRC